MCNFDFQTSGSTITDFELLRERCKDKRLFYCNIVLKDYTLLMIGNDLQQLLSVNKDEVYYIECAWWEAFGSSSEHGLFMIINSYYDLGKHRCHLRRLSCGDWFYPYSSFGIGILHYFLNIIDIEVLDSYIPQMFEYYQAYSLKNEKEKIEAWDTDEPEDWGKWAEKQKEDFISYWEDLLKGWNDKRSLLFNMNNVERVLYDKAADLIHDFDGYISRESKVSGDGQWCNIVQKTIMIVQSGGGVDDVVKHLEIYRPTWDDDITHNKHMKAAMKIVKLVRES